MLNNQCDIYHKHAVEYVYNLFTFHEYKYYDINMKSKEFNIKMVYKVLAVLFKKIIQIYVSVRFHAGVQLGTGGKTSI